MRLFRIVKDLQDYAKLTPSHAREEKASCHHSDSTIPANMPRRY
jgi:hypothetical protein